MIYLSFTQRPNFSGNRVCSRNVQWTFANGPSPKDRLEDLLFIFLDWHAVRNLYEVSGKTEPYSKGNKSLLDNQQKGHPLHFIDDNPVSYFLYCKDVVSLVSMSTS